jgi:hypothetical protein
MRRSCNATCLFGRDVSLLAHRAEEIAWCQKRRFQVSLELEKRAQSHARNGGEEQPLKEIQSTEVQDNCYARLLREVEPCGSSPQAQKNSLYEDSGVLFIGEPVRAGRCERKNKRVLLAFTCGPDPENPVRRIANLQASRIHHPRTKTIDPRRSMACGSGGQLAHLVSLSHRSPVGVYSQSHF